MRAVIIGNGAAGFTAARRIRELSPECELTVVTREPYGYYYRPRLPEVVAGEVDVADIVMSPPEWYESKSIDLRISTGAESVDTGSRTVVLSDGNALEYDTLLIASGSDPFVPPIDGASRAGVFTLRTADDALAIRSWAKKSKRAVVIGGGLLGLEAARGLAHGGLDVTVVEHGDWLLGRQLDETGGRILLGEIERMGIKVVTGATTSAIDGSDTASRVLLEDGPELQAELVLLSTGVRSTVGFLDGSGIEVERGVVVDCEMKTSVEGVYAAGDVAEFEGRSWGIIPVAVSQAEVAARSIAGTDGQPYCAVVPSNTLKITGIDVFSAGVFDPDDPKSRVATSVDEENGKYRKIVRLDGKIIGAIVVGSKAGVKEIGAIIDRGTPVGDYGDELADESFDFKAALENAS